MKLPSLQMLSGELTPTSALLAKAKHIGIGRPEHDTAVNLFGKPATILRGDWALGIEAPSDTFAGKSWTYQFYANIVGNTPVLSSNLYGRGNGEFNFRITPGGIYAYVSSRSQNVNYIHELGEVEIPKELRYGFRHYKITSDGATVVFYIDGVKVRTLRYPVNPPSNGLTFMGRQVGTTGALIEAAKAHVELIRFDWDYVVPATEDFVFKNQVSLDVARSFFDETKVQSEQFDLLRLTDVFNYAPVPTAAEIDNTPGVIPVMTAATGNGFTIATSSNWSDGYPGWEACNTFPPVSNTTAWISANVAPSSAAPHIWTIESEKPMKFNAYRIADRVGGSGRFISWEVQGKNANDTEWVTIHKVVDDQSVEIIRRFTDFPVAEFTSVRVVITKNSPVSGTLYSGMGHFQLIMLTGGASKKAFRYSDGDYVITNTPTKSTVGNHITDVRRVPKLGVMFDRYEVENRTWGTAASIQSAQSWVLQGRNADTDSWVDIDTVTDRLTNLSGAVTSHQLVSTVQFKQIRLYITATNGTNIFTSVGELRLYHNNVLQTMALTGPTQGMYSATSSSHFTSSGPYPAWMAFNQIADGGWVSASKATSASPQWLQLKVDAEETVIAVTTSDNKTFIAGPVNDRNPVWQYVQGNGYLINDNGTKKFVPLTLEGLLEVTIADVPYLIYTIDMLTPMSAEELTVGKYTVAQGAAYNAALTANAWKIVPVTTVTVNSVGIPVTGNKFILPKGKYYGQLNFSTVKTNGFVLQLKTSEGTVLTTTPGGFASSGIAGIGTVKAKMFFSLLVDTEVYLDAFAEAASVSSTAATVLTSAPITISSFNLFKVG